MSLNTQAPNAPGYDPGPVPEPTAAEEAERMRARQIAAIHALAEWYARHVDVPMPLQVVAMSYTYPYNGPEAERAAAVLDFAAHVGVKPAETGSELTARHELIVQDGMRVAISHRAGLEDVSARRYVR